MLLRVPEYARDAALDHLAVVASAPRPVRRHHRTRALDGVPWSVMFLQGLPDPVLLSRAEMQQPIMTFMEERMAWETARCAVDDAARKLAEGNTTEVVKACIRRRMGFA